MNKIKKVWAENKVLLVLAIILIICAIIIALVAITSFYNGSDNPYGNRLDITKKVPLEDSVLDEIKNKINEKEIVENVSVVKKGKIVYLSIIYTTNTKMENAKKDAESIVSLFTDEILGVYDLEFTIKTIDGDNTYALKGARNASGSGTIVWSNYKEEKVEGNKKS